nr:WAT1-related protein At3g28050-like [Spinacia oleracea]
MEVMYVGSNTLTKAAMAQGMTNNIYITYTHAISLLLLFPAAFLYHRKTPAPPIRRSTILRIFFLAIISYGCSMFFYAGIRNSSPTLASATSNLSLAFTFIIAIIFRVKGPVFVAMFIPLQMIIAVIMGVSFLGDVLHLGSVIGGSIIAVGFYTVMKGKAEEEMRKKDDENRLTYIIEEESHSLKIPMLHAKSMDVIVDP